MLGHELVHAYHDEILERNSLNTKKSLLERWAREGVGGLEGFSSETKCSNDFNENEIRNEMGGGSKVKKIKYLFLLLVFFSISACSASLTGENIIKDVHQLDYVKSQFRRLPTELPINEWQIDRNAMNNLSKNLQRKIMDERVFIPSYRVQAIGYFHKNKKYIWFNGFCFSLYEETDTYWKEKYVGVIGLGNCGFEGVYCIDEQKITQFSWGIRH